VAYLVAAAAALALALAGGSAARTAGVTLAINVLIGASFHVVLGPVLGERERKTLAFVMTLPVTVVDVTVAKLASAFLLFVGPAVLAAAATTVALPSLTTILGSTAGAGPSWTLLAGWVGYGSVAIGAWMLFFAAVLGTALVTESVGWTIGVLTGSVVVVGNIVLQVLPVLPGASAYIRSIAQRGPALSATIGIEVVGLAAVVALIVGLQRRKTSFV